VQSESDSRYTFSQVMNILGELETELAEFYRATAQRSICDDLKRAFLSYYEQTVRHLSTLKKMRYETVTEMTLEPITGLKLCHIGTEVDCLLEDKVLPDLEKALRLEAVMQNLYRDVAQRIMYISPDVGDLLEKSSRESSKRIGELNRLKV